MRKHAVAVVLAAMAMIAVAGGSAAHAGTDSTQGKFKLPFKGSASTSADAFQATNTGSGNGVEGDAGAGYGMVGFSSTGFAGIYGTTNGASSNGIYGNVNNSGGSGVYGHNQGTGSGVTGIAEGGYGLTGFSTSGFAGVYGSSPTNGVYGDVNNSGASGVYGHNQGSGNAVAGISDHGTGGYFAGGGGTNAALALQNGGIKIIGAGLDSPTPVFWHDATTANVCDSNKLTILDNPYLNGNGNAIVLVTGAGMKPGYGTLQVFYNTGSFPGCPTSRWLVSPDLNSWDTGWTNYFNVLVFNY